MDRLLPLLSKLQEREPLCCYCGHPLHTARVYMAFACLHVVCFECTQRELSLTCALCPGSALMDVDYRALEAAREMLAGAIRRLDENHHDAFPSAFEWFFKVMSILAPVEVEKSGAILEEEKVLSLPPQRSEEQKSRSAKVYQGHDFPPLPDPVKTYTCTCGNVCPINQECPCSFNQCEKCNVTPCICDEMRAANHIWECWTCHYEYNAPGSKACFKCGKVVRGSSKGRRPRSQRRR